MTFTIKLEQFEGPFDLLLFFIERDELDIYDIPIAKITNDFLSYIHRMEALNIDLASEFILVAATLMKIKARMLLPRKPVDEEGNEIDPREELVQRLIEYKQYKQVVEEMREMEKAQAIRRPRGNVSDELQEIANRALVDVELETLDLYQLLKAYTRLMEERNREKRKVHTIVRYNYTIQKQQNYLREMVAKGRQSFKTIFLELENRIHAIVTFLALLELVNMQQLSIIRGEGVNDFWIAEEEKEQND